MTNQKKGYLLTIIGGIGLGLLIGSELPGTYTTITGAILILTMLILTTILTLKTKNIPQP